MMDILLGKVTQQAMNYAIRSGIAITTTYAMRQCSRLLKTAEGKERRELQALQHRLENKIRIISPAIDMIELISARGNTSLESAVSLTKSLRWEIQALGVRLSKAASAEELLQRDNPKATLRAQHELELKLIIQDIKDLLNKIEDAVPLINLAITTSGASLSTSLPATVSPSRLLQASTFLTSGDAQYSADPGHPVQVGPAFTLSLYMLFSGHAFRDQDEEGIRQATWKEVIHKAHVKLMRIPLNTAYDHSSSTALGEEENANDQQKSPLRGKSTHSCATPLSGERKSDEFAYELSIIENLNDDRVHSFEDDDVLPGPYEDVDMAGIRTHIPIHQISKIFYADTGKILNIGSEGETNSPILLLKRDVDAAPPRRMMERDNGWYEDDDEPPQPEVKSHEDVDDSQAQIDAQLFRDSPAPKVRDTEELEDLEQSWSLPPDLDPEWLAFEVYSESEDTDDEDETEEESSSSSPAHGTDSTRKNSADHSLTNALSGLQIKSPASSPKQQNLTRTQPVISSLPPIKTSLSLLETLMRLTSLQQFQQTSHLSINDELLHFFLSESSTTGAGADSEQRKRLRNDARRRVGFDPYDESPVKLRGEDYQRQYTDGQYSTYGGDSPSRYGEPWSPDIAPSSPSPQQLFLRSRSNTPERSSPLPKTSVALQSAGRQAFLRRSDARQGKSPLGRGLSVETDSTLGTSPGTGPTPSV